MTAKSPRKPRPGQSLADLRPDLAKSWITELNGGLTAADISRASDYKAWWECPEGHQPFQQRVLSRTLRGAGCPHCANRKLIPVAVLHPWLADEWHPELNGEATAFSISHGSSFEAWWICPEGHKPYRQRVNNRTRTNMPPAGCPVCARRRTSESNKRPGPGESLADIEPSVAAKWHPTLNGMTTPADVRPHCRDEYWWRCPRGHGDYKTSVLAAYGTSRNEANGCERCGVEIRAEARRLPQPGLSIAEKLPAMAAEWDTEANGSVTPFDRAPRSKVPVHWVCPEGHRSTKSPADRYNCKKGTFIACAECRRSKRAA